MEGAILISPCAKQNVRVVFINRALPTLCGEEKIVFFVCVDFHWVLLAKNSIICNPFLVLEASFGDEKRLSEASSTLLLGGFIYVACMHLWNLLLYYIPLFYI